MAKYKPIETMSLYKPGKKKDPFTKLAMLDITEIFILRIAKKYPELIGSASVVQESPA
jgi:hypothetical protein